MILQLEDRFTNILTN